MLRTVIFVNTYANRLEGSNLWNCRLSILPFRRHKLLMGLVVSLITTDFILVSRQSQNRQTRNIVAYRKRYVLCTVQLVHFSLLRHLAWRSIYRVRIFHRKCQEPARKLLCIFFSLGSEGILRAIFFLWWAFISFSKQTLQNENRALLNSCHISMNRLLATLNTISDKPIDIDFR